MAKIFVPQGPTACDDIHGIDLVFRNTSSPTSPPPLPRQDVYAWWFRALCIGYLIAICQATKMHGFETVVAGAHTTCKLNTTERETASVASCVPS